MVACLNRVGVAVPPWQVHDTFVRVADSLLQTRHDRALLKRMVGRAGIEKRWSVLEPDPAAADDPTRAVDRTEFYSPGAYPSTGARMKLYESQAPVLAERAVRDLDLGDTVREVTHLLVVSCTGFVAPGLDLALVNRLGLNPGVERTMIGFMGCYAAMNGLKLARHIVRSEPAAKVLVVCVELCTLHFQETHELEKILSFSLFGDGAAAALVSSDEQGFALDSFQTLLVADEPDLITWTIRDQGFDMVLSGKVPATLQRALRDGSPLGDMASADAWMVHPGGRSVLDSVAEGLGLPAAALDTSRSVLADYGNMSSATILFVAKRLLESDAACTAGVGLAFGPGLTAETLRFHRV